VCPGFLVLGRSRTFCSGFLGFSFCFSGAVSIVLFTDGFIFLFYSLFFLFSFLFFSLLEKSEHFQILKNIFIFKQFTNLYNFIFEQFSILHTSHQPVHLHGLV
jgi:hypothetical protein